MVVHEVVGVAEVNGGFALEELVVHGEDFGLVGQRGAIVFVGGDAYGVVG